MKTVIDNDTSNIKETKVIEALKKTNCKKVPRIDEILADLYKADRNTSKILTR